MAESPEEKYGPKPIVPPLRVSRNGTNARARGNDTSPLAQPTYAVYLFGEITDQRAAEIVQQIEEIRQRAGALRLWICSLGGAFGGALAIHDALRRFLGSTAIATGDCQSAALVAFLGAEHRFSTPNTIFYNHDVVGYLGERFPGDLRLPLIAELTEIPKGWFGRDVAIQCGLLETVRLRDEAATADLPVGQYIGPGGLGIGPI